MKRFIFTILCENFCYVLLIKYFFLRSKIFFLCDILLWFRGVKNSYIYKVLLQWNFNQDNETTSKKIIAIIPYTFHIYSYLYFSSFYYNILECYAIFYILQIYLVSFKYFSLLFYVMQIQQITVKNAVKSVDNSSFLLKNIFYKTYNKFY